MSRSVRKSLVVLSIAVTIIVLIVIVNQLVQFSEVLSRISPVLGHISLGLFLSVLLLAVLTPVYLYVKLPGPLIPPKESDGASHDEYIKKLAKRLSSNPVVEAGHVEGLEDVKSVIKQLDEKSDLSIKRSANRAFITTAISQNGALDALFILGLQFRLIWEIAHIYEQRRHSKI